MPQHLPTSQCILAVYLLVSMLAHGTWGQLGDRREPKDLPRQEGRIQHKDNTHRNNYTQTGVVVTDTESQNVGVLYNNDYIEDYYEDERDIIPRPVDETFQGCRENVSDANFSAYINLTQMAELRNLTSKPGACHEYCLKSFPFSMFISLLESQSSKDFCGCHDDMDLSQLVSCSGNYEIYCGPMNVDCRNIGTTLQQTSLIATLILALLIT